MKIINIKTVTCGCGKKITFIGKKSGQIFVCPRCGKKSKIGKKK